jgi:hypothetical protein
MGNEGRPRGLTTVREPGHPVRITKGIWLGKTPVLVHSNRLIFEKNLEAAIAKAAIAKVPECSCTK